MSIAERIYETVKNMPEAQAAEVLDFAEYVKAKHSAPPSIKALNADERFAAIMAISRRCAALPELDPRSADEIIGYDENGLPV